MIDKSIVEQSLEEDLSLNELESGGQERFEHLTREEVKLLESHEGTKKKLWRDEKFKSQVKKYVG